MKILSHSQIWRINNPEKSRDYKLRSWYGITLSDYNRLLTAQNKKCFGCDAEVKLQIDHDHITGKIRGLLCFNCNNILARSNDSITVLNNLAKYLNGREERLKWLCQIKPAYELKNAKNKWATIK